MELCPVLPLICQGGDRVMRRSECCKRGDLDNDYCGNRLCASMSNRAPSDSTIAYYSTAFTGNCIRSTITAQEAIHLAALHQKSLLHVKQ